jgi:hypothetical protein
MKASKFLHAFGFSVITAFSGLSSPTLADDIDIYLNPGADTPQGDVGY